MSESRRRGATYPPPFRTGEHACEIPKIDTSPRRRNSCKSGWARILPHNREPDHRYRQARRKHHGIPHQLRIPRRLPSYRRHRSRSDRHDRIAFVRGHRFRLPPHRPLQHTPHPDTATHPRRPHRTATRFHLYNPRGPPDDSPAAPARRNRKAQQ